MSRCRSEALVSSEQHGAEQFRQGNVDRVIRRQIPSQGPRPRDEMGVAVPNDRHVPEQVERGAPAGRVEFAARLMAPKHLGHFGVEEMRRVDGVIPTEEAPG